MLSEERIEVADGVALRTLLRSADGDGIPILLVHGLASNAHLWDGVAQSLSRLGHPSAAVDLRGHGPFAREQDIAADKFGFDAITHDLVRVLDALGWGRCVAAGQSWGGNVVVELAALHPARLAGIACVDGGTIELSAQFDDANSCAEALRPPKLEGTPHGDFEQWMRNAHPDWPDTGIHGQLANFERREDDTIAPWLALEHHMAILGHLYAHRPSERWSALGDTPVLLLPAQNNDRVSVRRMAEIETAQRSASRQRVQWMTGDHDLHAQFPGEVAAHIHAACVDGFFA